MTLPSKTLKSLLAISSLAAILFNAGCGGGSPENTSPVESTPDNTEEVNAYYESKVYLPPAVFEALERGEITQEEIDQRKAAGEFEKFFVFATPEDLPSDLVWDNGMDLPELGSDNAKKGGIRYGRIQDFPRTLRVLGPDANGSFRNFILDDVAMQFAHRHPNVTEIGPQGHHYFPGIAESWAVDKEGRKVYVKINPMARWSDGEPITVEDVFFMFFMMQSPNVRAPWYNNWYNRNYEQVVQYDEHTFSIRVPEAKPDLNARILELRPLPRHFYREFGEDFVERYQWRFQPTSGAFVIEERNIQKGRFIALTRNKDWWAKDLKFWKNRFNYDRIQLTVVRDTAKAFEAFRKGELDMFGLNLSEYWYDKLPNDDELVQNGYVSKFTFYNQRPRPTFGLWINSARGLLSDINVRKGINYATNWEKVIDAYYRGDYIRMRTPSDGFGEFTHPTLQPRSFDVEKALEYFAKAGFTERGPDGILVNENGQRLAFTLTTGYEALRDIPTILQEEAIKAGLDFRVEVLDGTAAWKKVQEKQHEITFSAFGVFAEMYPRFWETWHSVNAYEPDGSVKVQTNNLTSLANDEMDALIEQYRASDDAGEMIRLAHRMDELVHETAVFVPGFVMPFFRWANWNWVKFPDDGNVQLAAGPEEYWVSWIEEEERDAILKARRAGESYQDPVIQVFDQYKEEL